MRVASQIKPNAAMLFPRPELITLAGATFTVIELQVETIGQLEREVADLLECPFDDDDRASIEFLQCTEGERENYKKERIAHYTRIDNKKVVWPPTFKTSNFIECLQTDVGKATFLAVMLRRSNPSIDDDTIVDIAYRMTPEEWEQLDRIAWGIPEWMEFGPSNDEGHGTARPGRGMDWAKTVDELALKRGWTYAVIGQMYVNQVINAINLGEPWNVWITDRKRVNHNADS